MNKEHLLTVTELWKKFIEKEFNPNDMIYLYHYTDERQSNCIVCGGKMNQTSVMLGQNSMELAHFSPVLCAEVLWIKRSK